MKIIMIVLAWLPLRPYVARNSSKDEYALHITVSWVAGLFDLKVHCWTQ